MMPPEFFSTEPCEVHLIDTSPEADNAIERKGVDLLRVEVAGLTASVGLLGALVDHLRAQLRKAASTMGALHSTASPIDESAGDLDARIPYEAFQVFTDEHAALLHELAQLAPGRRVEPDDLALLDRALEIADAAMFDVLRDNCVDQDGHGVVLGLTDAGASEVRELGKADEHVREAFDWLHGRGYVVLAKDAFGEHIVVERRPGE